MGMLRMGMQGVSATILNSRNTRKPLKKIQTPAPVPRNSAPVGSDRLILNLQQNATESDQQSANVGAGAHARAFLKSPETMWGQPPSAVRRSKAPLFLGRARSGRENIFR